MRLGLAARLALVFAALVAVTSIATTTAGVFSASREVNNDLDRFLQTRADEIVSGERPTPDDDRDGRGRRNGNGGRNNDSTDKDGTDKDSTDNGGDDNGGEVADAVDPDGELETSELSNGAIRDAVDSDAVVQALNPDGSVLSSIGGTLPVDNTDIALAATPGSERLRTVTSDGVDYRIITKHVDGGGAIQVGRDLAGTTSLLAGIRDRMVLLGLLLSVLAAGAGWLVARSTILPLRRLTESVEAVAETQDLSVPVGVDRSDEIGRLANEFDRMLGALDRSREQQHRLVHDAAHELRTPLTSIHANIEMLSRAPDLDPGARSEILGSVRSELGQLNALFTEIIELATDVRDAPNHRSVDLARVAEAAVRSFEARSATAVEFRTEQDPQTGATSEVSGDPVGLERVIGNLLGNAEKYSPDEAPILVEVVGTTVAVTDHGPGIPADEREKVFDRFYRSDQARSQPGSGLGLSIVKKIVDDHGGRAWITEAAGGGTRAGFTLPVAGPDHG